MPVPWGVLGQGKFKTPEQLKERANRLGGAELTETELKIAGLLAEVAKEIGPDISPAHGE